MDLSFLKWPVIIVAVVGVGWLFTEGGTNYIYKSSIEAQPGADPDQDKVDESRLTSLATYLMTIFRYEKAKQVLESAYKRYPEGEHAWYNYYRLARMEEKLKNYQRAADIIHELWQKDAKQFDDRIPPKPELHLRLQTLIEVHGLKYYDDMSGG